MKRALQHLQAADPVLGSIIERIGPYRMQFRDPNFHTLVRSIVYQQLSGKAALTIFNRLIAAAQMFLIFALRRPDVLPTGDLGVRAAIKKAYNLPGLPSPAEMEKIAAAWR